MLLGETQSIFANWNNLCHNPLVNEQWRKRWSTVSPCFMHNLHMSGLSALWGLLNCSKSLVLTFLYATNQTKDLTLKGTCEFQTNLVGNTGGDSEYWDKTRKKDLTVKRLEGDKDQDLLSGTEGDMCRRSRDRIRLSKSSISESVRFRRKLKFQEKGREYPRIDEIGAFLSMTTLSNLGYWIPKGWFPHHKSSQKRILSPSPTTNRVNLENSWKTSAMAFQGQRWDHLTLL